jgi:hypothetical protein
MKQRFAAEQFYDNKFIRKVWFNTPRLAAAQIRQRLQRFGIEPDGIINFLTRSNLLNNATLTRYLAPWGEEVHFFYKQFIIFFIIIALRNKRIVLIIPSFY